MTTTDTNETVARFLTVGGATVEVRRRRFESHYKWEGRPWVFSDNQTRTVDGFVWRCYGCGTPGMATFLDSNYLDCEADKARNDANEHAATCRAMPLSSEGASA